MKARAPVTTVFTMLLSSELAYQASDDLDGTLISSIPAAANEGGKEKSDH